MFEGDNKRQIQDDEKLVIESIFGNDAKFPEQKWKVWRPLNVTIRLEPQTSYSKDCKKNGEETRKVAVDFRIQCNEDYPQSCPKLDFPTVQGISQGAASMILEHIKSKAQDMIGNVMITDLCEEIRMLLAKQDNKIAGSFHDDMMKKKANEVVEFDRQRRDSERRELEQVAEVEEKIALERQQQRETEVVKQINRNVVEGEHRMIAGRRIAVLPTPVKRKKPHPCVREWMGSYEKEQLLVSEWSFNHTQPRNTPEDKKLNFEPFLKLLEDVCSEDWKVLAECNKKRDINLVEYAFIHVYKASNTPTNFHVQVFVAQKVYPSEDNLQEVFGDVAADTKLLRCLAAQAVCGLRYLHEQQSSHGSLNMSTVWLIDTVFRFSDYMATADMIKLHKLFTDITNGKNVELNEKREEKEKPRKKDYFDLGTLLDQLLLEGRSSNYSRAQSTEDPEISTDCTLPDFIIECQGAANIDKLVEHKYLNRKISNSGDDDSYTSLGGDMDRNNSRLINDFVVQRMLGKGGFGDVMLARNKLDSMDYAVKRIPLNAGNERLNKRIKKEAKLFAKLNHPNVVRYFSAWEEDLKPYSSKSDSSDESLGAVPLPRHQNRAAAGKQKLELKEVQSEDSLMPAKLRFIGQEKLEVAVLRSKSRNAIPETSEWSTSFQVVNDDVNDETTSSSSDLDENEVESGKMLTKSKISTISSPIQHSPGRIKTLFSQQVGMGNDELVMNPLGESGDSFYGYDDDEEEDDEDETEESRPLDTEEYTTEDDDVVFEKGSEHKEESDVFERNDDKKEVLELEEVKNSPRLPAIPKQPRVLIIQMEYCEKGTLRQFIDDNSFFRESSNVWRIFSETLSGLQYIHNQGMIHRDIKPMNIFLNSQQSVKIGDFGLATRELFRSKKKNVADKTNSIEAMLEKTSGKHKSSDAIGGATEQTRDIGTQLYMAPELFDVASTASKKPYTSKIDVYSLGIVLFEMFYRPLVPGMERISTLNALRDQIVIPADFEDDRQSVDTLSARKTIEKMLQRNPDDRPTVDDLLRDENLPMNKGEDAQIQKHLSKIAKKRGSKIHKYILDTLFEEEVPSALNYCYDSEICKERFATNLELITENLRNEITNVMKPHAYELIDNHTIVPAATARAAAPVRLKPCEFLDRSGLPVAFQFDLRQSFVRFCVRNAINRFKRYSFGKVYHVDDSKCNTHPQERWECCVDSIGPLSASVSLDAELMLTACLLAANSLKDLKLTLRIGNIQLVDAVLRHLKISEDCRSDVLNILHCFTTSDRIQSHAEKVELLNDVVGSKLATSLLSNLPCETTLVKFRESCKFLLKSRNEYVQKTAEKVLQDLEKIQEIFSYAANDDVSKINFIYDAQTIFRPRTFCDGLVFQITAEISMKNSPKNVSVLAGGRYDSALVREYHPRDLAQPPRCLSGYSVHMGTLARFRKIELSKTSPTTCSTVICSFYQNNNDLLLAEKFKLARALWALNIPADVLHEPVSTVAELTRHCDTKSLHLLAVCNSVPEVLVRRCNGPDSKKETKMSMEAAIAAIYKYEKSGPLTTPLSQTGVSLSALPLLNTDIQYEDISAVITTPLSASRSVSGSLVGGNGFSSSSTRQNVAATSANMNISFASSEKIVAKDKKRIEQQVRTHLSGEISVYSPKSRIEVIACDVGKELIKRIVGELSKSSPVSEFNNVFDQLTRQNHGKMAKDLDVLFSQIQLVSKNTASPIHQSSSQIVVIIYRHVDNFYRTLT